MLTVFLYFMRISLFALTVIMDAGLACMTLFSGRRTKDTGVGIAASSAVVIIFIIAIFAFVK